MGLSVLGGVKGGGRSERQAVRGETETGGGEERAETAPQREEADLSTPGLLGKKGEEEAASASLCLPEEEASCGHLCPSSVPGSVQSKRRSSARLPRS